MKEIIEINKLHNQEKEKKRVAALAVTAQICQNKEKVLKRR